MDYTQNWSSVCIKLESVSITSTCYVHTCLENFVLGIPGYLVPYGTVCMVGLPGTVLGIPGYLVFRDPWDSTPGGTTRDCPGYPGILSISGSMGLHAWWGYLGLSWVYQDT